MIMPDIKAFGLGNCPWSPFREIFLKIDLCHASLGLQMLLAILKSVLCM